MLTSNRSSLKKKEFHPQLEDDEEEEDFIVDLPIFCETHPYIKLKESDGFHHCPICSYGLYSQNVINQFKLMPPRGFN